MAWKLIILTVAIVALVAGGLTGLVSSYFLFVLAITLANAIAAIGLVVVSGVAGQMSLATSGLLAIGAYVAGVFTTTWGLPFALCLIAGPVLASLLGTLLAAPAIRLSGLHLAIVTLAFGVIVVQLIGKGGSLTGGMSGLTLPKLSIAGIAIDNDARRLALVGLATILTLWVSHNLLRFKVGRALFAIHEREAVAQALGVNIRLYKSLAFAYGSFLAGLAGVLTAAVKGFISVDDFTIHTALYAFVMVAVGGMTSIWGGLIGAAFVTLLPEFLRGFREASDLVFGILLTLVIAVLPGGLASLSQVLRSAIRSRSRQVGE